MWAFPSRVDTSMSMLPAHQDSHTLSYRCHSSYKGKDRPQNLIISSGGSPISRLVSLPHANEEKRRKKAFGVNRNE